MQLLPLHGFNAVYDVVERPGTKRVRDWYARYERWYYIPEPYNSKMSLAERFTKGESFDGTRGYSRKYDESLVYQAINSSYDTRRNLEEKRPTWLQHARLNIRDSVYAATRDNESPCVTGTIDGMFWLGHVYCQFKRSYTSVPYAMALGQLPREATDDDSHGWYTGIVRHMMRAVWEERADGLKPVALDKLAEYCGCMYALLHHCSKRAMIAGELDTDMAMAIFDNFYDRLVGRSVRNPFVVNYF